MSDDEAMEVEQSYSGGGGDDGDSDGGPVHPCCAWACGLICIVVACPYMFLNEGAYVHGLQMVEGIKQNLVEVCEEGCSSCDFGSVTKYMGRKKRPMEDGDIVYLSCNVQGLKSLDESKETISNDASFVTELKDGLKESGTAKPAAWYSWKYEMKQAYWEEKNFQSIDLKNTDWNRKGNLDGWCESDAGLKYGQCTPRRKASAVAVPTPRPTPKPTPTPPAAADPTCAKGKKSVDGATCCDNKCSVCAGGTGCGSAAGVNTANLCCKSKITQSCSTHGAPCLIQAPVTPTPRPTPPPTQAKPVCSTTAVNNAACKCGTKECTSGQVCNSETSTCVVPNPQCTLANAKKSNDEALCCPSECVDCAGSECSKSPGSADKCCRSKLVAANNMCSTHAAPCLLKVPESTPVCSNTDGATPVNNGKCKCGNTECNNGQLCTAATSLCKAPLADCSNLDGSVAVTNAPCKCGTAECTTGTLCKQAENKCETPSAPARDAAWCEANGKVDASKTSLPRLCCAKTCLGCGNGDCGKSPGNANDCCRSKIRDASPKKYCTDHPPPCIMSDTAALDEFGEFISFAEVEDFDEETQANNTLTMRRLLDQRDSDSFLGTTRRRPAPSTPRRRREVKKTSCKVTECKYHKSWLSDFKDKGAVTFSYTNKASQESRVTGWTYVPTTERDGELVSFSPPENVLAAGWPGSNGGSYKAAGLKLGTKEAGGALEIPADGTGDLAKMVEQMFPAKLENSVNLATRASGAAGSSALPLGKETSGTAGGLKVSAFDRSKTNWTFDHTVVNWGNIASDCPEGCMCTDESNHGKDGLGQVRVCMKQSSVTRVTLMAAVKKVGDKWTLATSNKFMAEEAPGLGSGVGREPFRVFPNVAKTPAEILKGDEDKVKGFTNALRVILPLILWFGFYCCLTPIVWIIDQAGDAVDELPCIGGLLDGMLECMETLATIVICVVSCCSALMCSLFIMAFAWLWYRPFWGCLMIAGSCLLCGGMAFFAINQKGSPKVKESKRSKRRSQMAPPETQLQEVDGQTQMQVQCPAGCGPGSPIQVQAPNGQMVQITVPDGVEEGQMFMALV